MDTIKVLARRHRRNNPPAATIPEFSYRKIGDSPRRCHNHGLWVTCSSFPLKKTYPPPARLITVGLACSHINNLRRKLVLTPKLFPIVSVKCGERDVENVRVRIAYIQLTTSVELGSKVL